MTLTTLTDDELQAINRAATKLTDGELVAELCRIADEMAGFRRAEHRAGDPRLCMEAANRLHDNDPSQPVEHTADVALTTAGAVIVDGFPCRPTVIDGIFEAPEGAMGQYAVTFTLYVDADDLMEADERASQLRDWFVNRDLYRADAEAFGRTPWEPEGFYFHLHDHDGC
jgi:hypothetical protein